VISVQITIIQSYANSRAGDRAGFFVVKERVVPGREKGMDFKRDSRRRIVLPAADLLFFPCSALLFLAELPILRVFLQFSSSPAPLYRDLQWTAGWGGRGVGGWRALSHTIPDILETWGGSAPVQLYGAETEGDDLT
jgi:hypothetical protein